MFCNLGTERTLKRASKVLVEPEAMVGTDVKRPAKRCRHRRVAGGTAKGILRRLHPEAVQHLRQEMIIDGFPREPLAAALATRPGLSEVTNPERRSAATTPVRP